MQMFTDHDTPGQRGAENVCRRRDLGASMSLCVVIGEGRIGPQYRSMRS
jgi:hypothetical protein